ncbi:hypothetical protein, partial [Hydromonas duriensis]|uniref:hypothetical protein n=1 Tax=Hydromonas duriensis TaxID=1527608 RepID=UPI0013C36D73
EGSSTGAGAAVKPGSICPKTGFWRCPQFEKQLSIYMRQGDIMPGQSYRIEGMNMYPESIILT